MSDTFSVGQIFTGAASLGLADTGQVAFTQVGSVDFDTSTTPVSISNVTITQDELASQQSYDGIIIESVTIESVSPDQVITLTSADLPPGITVPPGTLPQNVVATLLGVVVSTNSAFVPTATGTVGVIGVDGSLELVGHVQITTAFGTIDTGGAVLSFGSQDTGSSLDENFSPSFSAAPCFAAGTRIATPAGDISVEELREGDAVLSAFGGEVPIAWLGHRTVDCRHHPKPRDVWPVRIAPDAFGPGQPHCPLLLSPDHAVYIDQSLVPVRYLINDATIVQEPAERITYFHVELPAHDVLLAEGLPAESYLDTGNRSAFGNGGAVTTAHPDFSRGVWQTQGCATLVTSGASLTAIRGRLFARAIELGHVATTEADPQLITAAGILLPRVESGRLVWELPDGTDGARLVSHYAVPAWMQSSSDDHRRLGIAVAALRLNGQEVPPAARQSGWHPAESHWQWTDGDAYLAIGSGRLELETIACGFRYWAAPTEYPKQMNSSR